ncbi:DUF6308 family protein [Sanguibacter antarcticus]|uniref:Uncharacterized protein n=1 Tax=Sanguibacter antarcticus TaxID=372484 RepID=A0A2A9E6Q1_9MICO|nr:DUF6308 family protein [Sanguibacter antarcticus]PFG34523.1 hypothetical protein ATL42_2437 [Sanguibacter antarcticus]
MTTSSSDVVADRPDVRVGGARTSFDAAHSHVLHVLNTPEDHGSYPAYDAYEGGPSERLSSADLLAPWFVGAPLASIATYDALVDNLPSINAVLSAIPLETSLVGATYDDLGSVLDLYAFLDTHPMPGVSLTTFSALLHRKRPRLVPVFDKHISSCYLDVEGAPLKRDDRRSYAAFAQLWLRAVQRDLDSQLDTWAELTTLVPLDGPPISALRAMHIVGSSIGTPSPETGILTEETTT